MVNNTEAEALARSLMASVNDSNLAQKKITLEQARAIINGFLPQFANRFKTVADEHIKKYDQIIATGSPKDAKLAKEKKEQLSTPMYSGDVKEIPLSPRVTSTILYAAAKSTAFANSDQETCQKFNHYIREHYDDQRSYGQNFKPILSKAYNDNREYYGKMGKKLQGLLSTYADADTMQELMSRYKRKGVQADPSERYPGDKAKAESYQRYLESLKRANDVLSYLNRYRINMRIGMDDLKSNEIAAYLPEHGNMKVTLMADDPKRIGLVNTWQNQYGYDKTMDPMKYPSTLILDTIINPSAKISSVNSFPRKPHANQQTKLTREDMPGASIFVTSQSKHMQSMQRFAQKVKESHQEDAIPDEIFKMFDDDSGVEDEKDDVNITQQDKDDDLAKRNANDWVMIDTPEKLKADRQNKGLALAILTQAKALNLKDVVVSKNSKGVYRFDYSITNPVTGGKKASHGILGGYIPPEKDGTYKLQFNGKVKGYAVPGMRAYINEKTGDLNVMPFKNILYHRLRKTMADEVANPDIAESAQAYKTFDSLYSTDGYSTVLPRKGVNSPSYERALIKTLKRRIRISDSDIAMANALNENPDHVQQNLEALKDKPNNARTQMLATQDLRTIPKQWQKVVDNEMTGIGHTMGASLFIGDGVKINKDGSLTPDPEHPDHAISALHKDPMFQWDKYDPADRNIMAFNQAIRNIPWDVSNVAMMTLSGYTENDACVVSKHYAETHPQHNKDGSTRPSVAGDKITDAHGNKSTISVVIDPDDKNPETQKKYAVPEAIFRANPDLDIVINPYSSISRLNTGSVHEMQARGGMKKLNNPEEFPDIDISNITMGKETYGVCEGQRVDNKTVVYDDDAFKKGKARKFSHQAAAALASADMPKTLSYIYSHNTNMGWPKFFDDLHILGYDVDKDHNVGHFDYDRKDAAVIELPDKRTIEKTLQYDRRDRNLRDDFGIKLKRAWSKVKDTKAPIIMELPGSYVNAAGQKTNKIVIPYQQMIADKKLSEQMGTMDNKSSSMWKNTMHRIYRIAAGIDLSTKSTYNEKTGKYDYDQVYNPDQAVQLAKDLGSRVLSKDFGAKKNIIKGDIYSAPMKGSATAVVTPDPSLDLDETAVGKKIYLNLLKEDPNIADKKSIELLQKDPDVDQKALKKILSKAESVKDPNHAHKRHKAVEWRDPILRDGGIRAVYVKYDPRLTGQAVNPVNTKSKDEDFDGDQQGIVPINDDEVQDELEKLKPSNNLIDYSTGSRESFLETGLELTGSLYKQEQNQVKTAEFLSKTGVSAEDTKKLLNMTVNAQKDKAVKPEDAAKKLGISSEKAKAIVTVVNNMHAQGDPIPGALDMLNSVNVEPEDARQIMRHAFDSHSAYGIGLDLTDKKSYLDGINQLILSGAKGHYEKDQDGKPVLNKKTGYVKSKSMDKVEYYYDGKRTPEDMHGSMVALAVKADVVGPAGKEQQKYLWALRDHNPKAALDVTYNTTNGALQAKHDAKDAVDRETQIVSVLPQVIQGKDPHSPNPNYAQQLSVKGFEHEVANIYNIELGMDLSKDTINSLAESLATPSKDGKGPDMIMTPKEREALADPIDILAYRGGSQIHNLNEAMQNGRKIAAGKYSKCFSMPEELCAGHVLDIDDVKSQAQEKQTQAEQKESQKQAEKQQEANNSLTALQENEDLKKKQTDITGNNSDTGIGG